MSLERAYKNCKRCYEQAELYKELFKDVSGDDGKSEKTVKLRMLGDDSFHSATNEAMKALEEIRITGYSGERKIAERALRACMKCDFSESSIVDMIDKEKEYDKDYPIREHID